MHHKDNILDDSIKSVILNNMFAHISMQQIIIQRPVMGG